jgi:general secretion pathway protein L
MIYLKTGIGVELRGEDMLISSLQSNFSGDAFTHFKRIANYQLRDREDLRRELAHFFKSNKLSKDLIVLGIPRKDLILRYLDLPVEVADNLKQVVQYQVQSFEPTEEDRFYYDYAVLSTNGSKKRLSVLLAMVKKSLLDEHLQLLIALGIRPALVTGSSMALSNMFLHGRKDLRDKIFILADLSSSSMELLALRYGTLAYSREVPKQNNQRWGDLTLRELNEATSKTRLGPEDTLERIVLAGESAEVAHAEIAAVIPDCELLKNTIDIDVPGVNKPHIQEAGAALGLAYTGLARRPPVKLNFLPEELRIHQTRWAYVPAVVFGLAILVLFASLGFHRMFQNQALVRKLDRELQSLKGPVERVHSLRSQSDAVEARIRSFEDRLRNRDKNLEVLRELTTLLPADTYLSTYTYRDGTIQLAGSSASAPKLIAELEKSPLLKDVTQRGGIFKEPQTGKDRFSFEAKVER